MIVSHSVEMEIQSSFQDSLDIRRTNFICDERNFFLINFEILPKYLIQMVGIDVSE